MTSTIHLYLASTSPRRKELLAQIGIQFQTLSIDVDEINHQEAPKDYVDRLALNKAKAGWDSPERREECPVLGADTIVVLNGVILEKPKDKADGIHMLQQLSGHTHEVHTSVALVHGDRHALAHSVSLVTFRDLSLAEAEAYWGTGEPADKAGGYAVQGKAAVWIERIEGSYSGIMGLPLYETGMLLREFGISSLT
jgi:septum formation protein